MWPKRHLALIKVEYEVAATRAGCAGCDEARRDDSAAATAHRRRWAKKAEGPTNIASHEQHQRGDMAKGFAEADVIVEREFVTGTVHQGYIEPQTATALWNADDQITVWTQHAVGLGSNAKRSAKCCSVPISSVRVIPTGDRRRLWRQTECLSGAAGGPAEQEGRPQAGQNDDEP